MVRQTPEESGQSTEPPTTLLSDGLIRDLIRCGRELREALVSARNEPPSPRRVVAEKVEESTPICETTTASSTCVGEISEGFFLYFHSDTVLSFVKCAPFF